MQRSGTTLLALAFAALVASCGDVDEARTDGADQDAASRIESGQPLDDGEGASAGTDLSEDIGTAVAGDEATSAYLVRFHRLRGGLIEAARPLDRALLAWHLAKDDEAAYEDRAVAPGAEYLFDRRVDPGENVNLVAREAAEAERLRELLDAHLAAGDAGVVEEGVRIDPGIAGRLRAMGYLR